MNSRPNSRPFAIAPLPLTGILIAALVINTSCESVEFVRDHERDPSGTEYRPVPPTDFRATATYGAVNLAWQDLSGYEHGYVIDRSVDRGDYEEIVRLPPDVNQYTDSLSTLYFEANYRLRAFAERDGRIVADSTLESAVQVGDPTPRLDIELVSELETRLRWSSEGRNDYKLEIERREGSGEFEPVVILDYDGQFYRDRFSVKTNTSYTYRLRGIAGDRPYPEYSYARIDARIEPPRTPFVDPQPDYVDLNWWRSTLHRGWIIEKCIESTDECVTVEIDATNTGSYPGFKDYDVDRAHRYRYRVKSLNSNYSSAINVGLVSRILFRRLLSSTTSRYFNDIDRAGRNILMGTTANDVEVINPHTRQSTCSFAVRYRTGAISGDGRRIAVLAYNEDATAMVVQFFDCEQGQVGARFDVPPLDPGPEPQISMNEAGTHAYIGDASGTLAYDHQNGLIWSTRGNNIPSYNAAVSDPLDTYLVETGPTALRVRSSSDGATLWTLPVSCHGVTRSSISSDGRLLACPTDYDVNIYSLQDGDIVTTLPIGDRPEAVGFSADGQRLAVLTSELRIWDLNTRNVLSEISNAPGDLDWWWITLPYHKETDSFMIAAPRAVFSLSEVVGLWDRIGGDQ